MIICYFPQIILVIFTEFNFFFEKECRQLPNGILKQQLSCNAGSENLLSAHRQCYRTVFVSNTVAFATFNHLPQLSRNLDDHSGVPISFIPNVVPPNRDSG